MSDDRFFLANIKMDNEKDPGAELFQVLFTKGSSLGLINEWMKFILPAAAMIIPFEKPDNPLQQFIWLAILTGIISSAKIAIDEVVDGKEDDLTDPVIMQDGQSPDQMPVGGPVQQGQIPPPSLPHAFVPTESVPDLMQQQAPMQHDVSMAQRMPMGVQRPSFARPTAHDFRQDDMRSGRNQLRGAFLTF